MKIKHFRSEDFAMKYLITADIRGVKYYIRIIIPASHGRTASFSHVGLKNNATKFNSESEAEETRKEIQPQTDWRLKVERA
jgi:hypothetical protein